MLTGALVLMSTLTTSKDFARRAADWRNGAVVYQVMVDRFAPSVNLEAKKALYASPKRLLPWTTEPKQGKNNEKLGMWSHEIDFWGGDLASFESKQSYIKELGADVVYFLPIFEGFTNHKYDTMDYTKIDPQYGTREDLRRVVKGLHRDGMKVMLDGVFNHLSQYAPIFTAARADATDARRDWFFFDDKGAYRAYANVRNMPAWNLENKSVRDYLWNAKSSIIRQYLKDGVDGWRLDVAFEVGPQWCDEITKAAHKEKNGSWVVGEVAGYPSDWFPQLDGTYNFTPFAIGRAMLDGKMSGGQASLALQHMVEDAGIENLLRSWVHTDNHDTARLASVVPGFEDRNFVRAIQFLVPGSPVLYYGSELGMEGKDDPMNRAPMRWDLVSDSNPDLASTRKLVALRKESPALRYGDCLGLATEKLLGFVRTTDKVREAVIVVANPTSKAVTETFPSRVGRIMSWGELEDALSGTKYRSVNGMLTVTVPPKSVQVLRPITSATDGISRYHRIDPLN
ncbi:MAG: alpha-amylase family glycosyl hydrolase [Armatimonadota bacterium]